MENYSIVLRAATFLAFAGVTAALLVVLLAYRWTRNPVLRSFAFLLSSFTGIALSLAFPQRFAFAGKALETASEIVYLIAMPRFVLGALGLSVGGKWIAAYCVFVAAIAADFVRARFFGIGRADLFFVGAYIMSIASVAFMAVRIRSVEDHLLRRLFRRFLSVLAFFIPLTMAQVVGRSAGWAWVTALDTVSVSLCVLAVSSLVVLEASGWLSHIAEQKLSSGQDGIGSDESTQPQEFPLRPDASGADPEKSAESPGLDHSFVPDFRAFDFSPRQRQIARMILQGYSAKEIGAKLRISAKTAENHTYALYRKVGARSRLQFYEAVRRVSSDAAERPRPKP